MKDEGAPSTTTRIQEKSHPQDLKERTKAFALRVIRLYSALPKSTLAQTLGKQVLRSGTVVGTNYREAFRARSSGDS
jgi:four helix bundle protein